MEIIRTIFHYFAEGIAFRFLYSEKGSLAKIDNMDNGDAPFLAFFIESKRGFIVMKVAFTAYRMPDKSHASTSSIVSVSFSMR